MFTPAEVKHAVDIFESIIFIPDSLKAKRQRIALIGTGLLEFFAYLLLLIAVWLNQARPKERSPCMRMFFSAPEHC